MVPGDKTQFDSLNTYTIVTGETKNNGMSL